MFLAGNSLDGTSATEARKDEVLEVPSAGGMSLRGEMPVREKFMPELLLANRLVGEDRSLDLTG